MMSTSLLPELPVDQPFRTSWGLMKQRCRSFRKHFNYEVACMVFYCRGQHSAPFWPDRIVFIVPGVSTSLGLPVARGLE